MNKNFSLWENLAPKRFKNLLAENFILAIKLGK